MHYSSRRLHFLFIPQFIYQCQPFVLSVPPISHVFPNRRPNLMINQAYVIGCTIRWIHSILVCCCFDAPTYKLYVSISFSACSTLPPIWLKLGIQKFVVFPTQLLQWGYLPHSIPNIPLKPQVIYSGLGKLIIVGKTREDPAIQSDFINCSSNINQFY